MSPQLKATLQALLVTFLWSSSWVLIKLGLQDIPALTFAGLRYSLAFLCLLPFVLLNQEHRRRLARLSRQEWAGLVTLGGLYYAVTQGAQFLGLAYLPAVMVSILLNFTGLVVAGLGMLFLNERPGWLQWSGMAIFLAGMLAYFYPAALPGGQVLGIGIVLVGVLANAVSAVLGRGINRRATLPPLLVTVVSMGIGALLLLAGGLYWQGLPALSLGNGLIIAWLAVVNTAFAFTLWNHTLRQLSAMESTVINSTMMIQIALLAWLFLGEPLGTRELAGMALAGIGALLVQVRPKKSLAPANPR